MTEEKRVKRTDGAVYKPTPLEKAAFDPRSVYQCQNTPYFRLGFVEILEKRPFFEAIDAAARSPEKRVEVSMAGFERKWGSFVYGALYKSYRYPAIDCVAQITRYVGDDARFRRGLWYRDEFDALEPLTRPRTFFTPEEIATPDFWRSRVVFDVVGDGIKQATIIEVVQLLGDETLL